MWLVLRYGCRSVTGLLHQNQMHCPAASALSGLCTDGRAPSPRQLFYDADEMGDLGDHATNGWGVFALDDLVETGEAEALDDELVLDRSTDLRTEVLQFDFGDFVLLSHERAPEYLVRAGLSLELVLCLAAQGGDFGL